MFEKMLFSSLYFPQLAHLSFDSSHRGNYGTNSKGDGPNLRENEFETFANLSYCQISKLK